MSEDNGRYRGLAQGPTEVNQRLHTGILDRSPPIERQREAKSRRSTLPSLLPWALAVVLAISGALLTLGTPVDDQGSGAPPSDDALWGQVAALTPHDPLLIDGNAGFTNAMAEAQRCLMCGPCSECLACEAVCEPGAILHDQHTLTLDNGRIINLYR